MSKFLDRMEKIRNGSPMPIGFGAAARAEKLPGMVLVGLISRDHPAGVAVVANLAPDAALLAGLSGPPAIKALCQSLPSSVPWGTQVLSLTEVEAQGYRDSGCDLLAFSLSDTSVSAIASEEVARILCVDPGIEERELRAIESLPVDALLLPMHRVSGPWTLRDLASVGSVSRRVSKYILVEVSQPPGRKELEALRDIGVHGLLVDVGAVSSEALAELKTALLEMPRPKSPKGGRASALLPGSAFSAPPPPPREDEEEDDPRRPLRPRRTRQATGG